MFPVPVLTTIAVAAAGGLEGKHAVRKIQGRGAGESAVAWAWEHHWTSSEHHWPSSEALLLMQRSLI